MNSNEINFMYLTSLNPSKGGTSRFVITRAYEIKTPLPL